MKNKSSKISKINLDYSDSPVILLVEGWHRWPMRVARLGLKKA